VIGWIGDTGGFGRGREALETVPCRASWCILCA